MHDNITIVDIGKMCGVSTKTVSRVINEDKNVSDQTREKVLAAIKESGYQVNMFARALKGNPTGIIMIFTDRHDEEDLSSWHTLMLKYLFRTAKENGRKLSGRLQIQTHIPADRGRKVSVHSEQGSRL